jgi:hypothetical protein
LGPRRRRRGGGTVGRGESHGGGRFHEGERQGGPEAPRQHGALNAVIYWILPCSSARSANFSCHPERWFSGVTSTAVTLYSGRLVAQSLISVFPTFAPVSGRWKVVNTTPGWISSVMVATSVVSPFDSPGTLCPPLECPWATPGTRRTLGFPSVPPVRSPYDCEVEDPFLNKTPGLI